MRCRLNGPHFFNCHGLYPASYSQQLIFFLSNQESAPEIPNSAAPKRAACRLANSLASVPFSKRSSSLFSPSNPCHTSQLSSHPSSSAIRSASRGATHPPPPTHYFLAISSLPRTTCPMSRHPPPRCQKIRPISSAARPVLIVTEELIAVKPEQQ